MIEIRTARAADMANEIALWSLVFGDDDAYIMLYYNTCYRPDDAIVLLEDGRLVSMALCPPVGLKIPGGKVARGAYIYALATAPEARGKGYARKLLMFAHDHFKRLGMDFSATVPAEESLFCFFQSVGYGPQFLCDERRYMRCDLSKASGASAELCDSKVYNATRLCFNFKQPAITYDESLILWQQEVSVLAGAHLFRIEAGGDIGCAAAEYMDGGMVIIKELLISQPNADAAVSALSRVLPADAYIVRTPADGSEPLDSVRRFGAAAWYNTAFERAVAQWPNGYLGLAFD